MSLTIKCNSQPRELFALADIPTEGAAEFNYIEESDMLSLRLFQYRGEWYDLHEFEIAPHLFKSRGFDGIQSESYFSAIIVKYFDADGYELDDSVIVGYAHW